MESSQIDGAVQSECLPCVSSDPTSYVGCGLKSSSSIQRQPSIFSFTLEEFQNVLGEPRESFGSMNMDELLKNIWTVEESQAMAAAMGSGSGAVNRQTSISLPRTISQKTVYDVWKDISRDSTDVGSSSMLAATADGAHGRQVTFGEMTLEDLLVKAGVVRKDDPGMASSMPPGASYDKNFRSAAGNVSTEKFLKAGVPLVGMKGMDSGEKAGNSSMPMLALSSSNVPAIQGGLEPMQEESINLTSPIVQQPEWLANNGFKAELPYMPSPQNILHQHTVESSVRKGMSGNGPMVAGLGLEAGIGFAGRAVPSSNSPGSLVNLKTGSPQSTLFEGIGAPYDTVGGMHSPLPYGGVEGGILRGRKRDFEASLEKVVERRHKRMIKNRESAARSRARKQAYTVELEAEVSHLKEENMRLRQYEEVMAERRRKQLVDVLATFGSHFAPKGYDLRRSNTGPW